MFFTVPSMIWPSARLATISWRCSARLSSSTVRRDTTILPRRRSILRIWNGWGTFISGPTSRTGRMSTWLRGRKATAPSRSTVKPPLTWLKMTPSTFSFFSNACSSLTQLSSRLALPREIDFDFVAKPRRRVASMIGEFLERHAPFSLEADVDDGHVLFDRDDLALDDRSLERLVVAVGLVQ